MDENTVVAALKQLDEHMQQGFTAMAAALGAVGIRIEHLETSLVRELRIVGNRLSSMEERLTGIDEKLTGIRDHVYRIEDRTLT